MRANQASRPRRITVVGDILLDRDVIGRAERLCPDAPAPVVDVDGVQQGPGGAGLTALLCRGPDVAVTLVTPLADDAPARELRTMLEAAGIEVVGLPQRGGTRTKTRIRVGGRTLARLDEGGPARPEQALPPTVADLLGSADVVLVSDYGAGTTRQGALRELLARRAGATRAATVVWDPHPRGGQPVAGCAVVTPNLAEARAAGGPSSQPAALAARLRRAWQVQAVCVTAGEEGAWLATSADQPFFAPAEAIRHADPCGAGDRFAASVGQALASGRTVTEAVTVAVEAASAWVRSGGTEGFRAGQRGTLPSSTTDPVGTTRARGGTVVATGGCFDLLHPGHVASLRAARALGDTLVVLLNSDASVRRLKGPDRPVQSQQDREQVLRALSVVDDVVVFDEDDPRAALARVRPDVWAKGGDYDEASMPEADLVRGWGGRVVLLPYLPGQSTTELLRRHDQKEIHEYTT